jgi:hypothetical protein
MKRYSFLFHLQKEKGVTKSAMEIPSSQFQRVFLLFFGISNWIV